MDEFSKDGEPLDALPGPGSRSGPVLTLVHSRPPAVLPWVVPAALGQLTGASMPGRRKGRPGRRPRALLIDRHLPQPDGQVVPALALARALRRLSYEVALAPVDGELDSPLDDLAQDGLVCLGLPVHGSIEDVLRAHAGVFDVVCLMGAALARTYEPLVRLHGPAARILCCLPGLAYPDLVRQAEYRPDLTAAARTAQRTEFLAAYVCDAAVVPAAADAELLQMALPRLAVHVVPWSETEAIDAALQRAVGSPIRSHRAVP